MDRRIVVGVWAGLCLAGLVATAALDAGPSPEEFGWYPAEEPTPGEAQR
ncbi:hypothetical protein GCM10022384_59250 [Streptomyces marokkonensis]|uniref:Uncharacterized protein n=1 Tax=Streptomyces marokkonensis TaxID=324855 RepID=A0ABP7S0Z3_9ACTN